MLWGVEESIRHSEIPLVLQISSTFVRNKFMQNDKKIKKLLEPQIDALLIILYDNPLEEPK